MTLFSDRADTGPRAAPMAAPDDPQAGPADGTSDRSPDGAAGEIRSLARPLASPDDLAPLIDRVSAARLVCIGEASHGTHEYYSWRAQLSRRLIEEHGFTWIGVEGDWPDCWRINRWVRGLADQDLDARGLLARFERWPTWMWANQDVAEFLTWLRAYNVARPAQQRVGFYGLDVYSLWDSLWQVMTWLEAHAPDAIPAALRAWRCFLPYGEDPHKYAWSTRLMPASCEPDVVALLVEVRRRARDRTEDAFDTAQNAEVAADAEHYYRTMVRGDRESWNIRDHHMADTIDRIAHHLGARSKGLIWEHNTHVGDARAHRHGPSRPGQRRPASPGTACRRRRRARGLRRPPRVGARRQLLGHAGAGLPGARGPGRQPRGPAPSGARPGLRSWSSATTGPGPGSPHGWGTGRSAWSMTRSTRQGITSRRASASATTR